MPDKERRLGRGLESLISSARSKSLNMELIQKTGHQVLSVPIHQVQVNPYQPRKEFALEPLNELVESLRAHGLMQPIVVRRLEDRFQIIAGERRWRASQELGWETIDAVVVEAEDHQMLEWALIENIQRQNLGPLELAYAFKQLVTEFGHTQEEVSKRMGMSRPSVANFMRLLELPPKVREHVSRGTVSMGAARALLGLRTATEQEDVARQVSEGKLTVRQVEALARGGGSGTSKPAPRSDPNQQALADEIQTLLGTRVALKGSLERGKLMIDYSSSGELDRIVRRLRGLAPALEDLDEGLSEESLTV